MGISTQLSVSGSVAIAALVVGVSISAQDKYTVSVRKQDPNEVISEIKKLLGEIEGVTVRMVGDRIHHGRELLVAQALRQGLQPRVVSGVPALEEAMKKAGKSYQAKIYPGAQHAFFNERKGDRHDKAAAADAWERMLAFFNENLKK